MTARGEIIGGIVVLDGGVALPDGADVAVQLIERDDTPADNLNAMLLRHAGKGRGLPEDLATHHDHYAHGKPKP